MSGPWIELPEETDQPPAGHEEVMNWSASTLTDTA